MSYIEENQILKALLANEIPAFGRGRNPFPNHRMITHKFKELGWPTPDVYEMGSFPLGLSDSTSDYDIHVRLRK